MYSFECLFSSLLVLYIGVGFMGHDSSVSDFLRNCQSVFHNSYYCVLLYTFTSDV